MRPPRRQLANLDLNLLRVLIVLGEECHMGRAAERLFVTQPAVSQSLKRLRHHFGEELFVRARHGLEPTAFTEGLLLELRPLMDELTATLEGHRPFNPAELDGPLRVVLSAHVAGELGPRLFDGLSREAPSARLELSHWDAESLDRITKGEAHLGVTVALDETPREIGMARIGEVSFTCYVRPEHPLVRKDMLYPEDLDGAEVARLLLPGWNRGDSQLQRLLRQWQVQVTERFSSDQSGVITEVVRNSDLVFPASSHIDPREVQGLVALPFTVDEELLQFPVYAYWHQRHRRNPLTQWLQATVTELLG